MKWKLLFSCEKEGHIFCTGICRHLPPLTRRTEDWFVLRLPPPPLSPPVSLWMIWAIHEWNQSLRSVSPLHCCMCLSESIRHAAGHQMRTSQQVIGGYVLIWIRENLGPEKDEEIYLNSKCYILSKQQAIKWPHFAQRGRNAQIWIYCVATQEPYIPCGFRCPPV